MTTYNNKHYNNRTRKIKLFKGGASPEKDITKAAIDKVIEEIGLKTGGIDDLIKNAAIDKVKSVIGLGSGSTGAPGAAGTGASTVVAGKPGKQISILIDFYKKLLDSEYYGNKLDNFNKFFEIVNINKNGINMTESITGVEELFKIFKNELEYIKAAEKEKDNKKKVLSSNREKTKEITIEYKNGDYTITGEPSVPTVSPTVSPTTSEKIKVPSIEENVKNTAINVVKSSVESIIITGKIESDIQEIAENAVFDAVIMKISDGMEKSDGTIDNTIIASDKDLTQLYNSISKLTNDLNSNNKNITSKTKSNTELINKNKQLESNKNTDLKIIRYITEELSKNNTKIKEYTKEILEKQAKNALINNLLVTLISKKENYLKSLNGIFKILIKQLSNTKILDEGQYFGHKKTGDFKKINKKIQIIEKKINILNKGYNSKGIVDELKMN